ncbi:CPBP family intramembrane glutamic endopeptidase [Neobacillus terrae]|uniref:CPBP family intramembrane glutamic endopeptidase n=1 Tax=Neobacillus terrae TaxID=3034837 RepID=UPI0014080048|nr:CPBP family intramembrane glutamic endopeptidase [Neobacillus terrae]NHM32244.1 CPBP family intramembrane metalloprotease [Neobacillus terrae]
MKKLSIGIIGFIFLDLYFNLAVNGLSNMYFQLASILLFFPLAHFIASAAGIGGLKALGLSFSNGWKRNFAYSFLIGFFFWGLMYAIRDWTGAIDITGVKSAQDAIMPIMEAVVGYFLGSLINDLIVRGYVFGLLKDKLPAGWIFLVSILIYALDDYWHEPFSLDNFVFSVLLGLSLTYAFYKTGTIWADTGLHFGLNMAFSLLYGLSQKAGSGIFLMKEAAHSTLLAEMLPNIFSLAMFLFLLAVIKFYNYDSSKNSFHSGITKTF